MGSTATPAMPKDFLRSCMLLLLREESAHGYELLERAAHLGFEGADPGGVYRILRKLEQDGSVRSAWEPSESGPQRRIYQITRGGTEELHRRAHSLFAGTELARMYLSRYEEFVALRSGKSSRPATGQRARAGASR